VFRCVIAAPQISASILDQNFVTSNVMESPSRGRGGDGGLGLPSFGTATQQNTHATHHPGYDLFQLTSYAAAAKRMLGEPTTPLFSITAFMSFEPNQVRAFATSATS
jgi:hypothetical protein